MLGAEVAYIGQKTDGSLPNILGVFRWANGQDGQGAIGTGGFSGSYGQGTWHNDWHGTDFDASRSSGVYMNGQTRVKSAGVYVMYCIKY